MKEDKISVNAPTQPDPYKWLNTDKTPKQFTVVGFPTTVAFYPNSGPC